MGRNGPALVLVTLLVNWVEGYEEAVIGIAKI
jgi:hypothetical protein